MSMRIDLDFRHGLTDPVIEEGPAAELALALTCRQECVVIHLSEASLDALWLRLTLALAKRHRFRPNGGSSR